MGAGHSAMNWKWTIGRRLPARGQEGRKNRLRAVPVCEVTGRSTRLISMWRCVAREKALSLPPSPSLPGLGTHQFNRRLPLEHIADPRARSIPAAPDPCP
jgi:hypothetical protein